jgi:hypothetical protein
MNSTHSEKSAKRIPWLAGALVAQLVLAVVLFNVGRQDPEALNEPLLALDVSTVDKMEITGEDQTLVLEKKGGQWQMGEGLLVQPDKVADIMKQLQALRRGWPVGNTPEVLKRFQVAEDSFLRKIRLLQGDKQLALLYVGSAPSFRNAHLRLDGEKEVFSLKFDQYSLSMGRDAWLDTNMLRPRGEILSLQLGEHKISKVDGKWPSAEPAEAAAGEGEGEQAQANEKTESAVTFDGAAYARTMEELIVLGVAEKQAEFDAPVTGDPAKQDGNSLLRLVWTVTTNEGSYEYQLLSKEDKYYLRRSDNDNTFRISKVQYDALMKIQELGSSANS